MSEVAGKVYKCTSCEKQFNHSSSLARHRKTCKHRSTAGDESSTTSSSGSHLCGICNVTFGKIIELCFHLSDAHSITAEIKHDRFSSADEFVKWRKEQESKACFEFIRARGVEEQKAWFVEHLYCHRSGHFESTSTGLRAGKAMGSIKAGFRCSAFAFVKTDRTSGEVSVNYCLDHYGHDHQAGRMRLSEDLRNEIGNYIRDKRSIDWILEKLCEDIKETPEDVTFTRRNCVTRDDIYNVINSLGLTMHKWHKNDAISVDLMVKDAAQHPNNPFFFYNPETTENAEFTLGIQTKFQMHMIKEQGKYAICADATHGTQRYKYPLVTIMVVDEFGKGQPCAWLITKSENENILTDFFKELRNRCGPVQAAVFMSDDAPQYYNGWLKGFCQGDITPPSKLLCIWHVERNWQNQLSKLRDRSPRHKAAVYQRLMVVLEQRDDAGGSRKHQGQYAYFGRLGNATSDLRVIIVCIYLVARFMDFSFHFI